jgi:hypothetical protein
MPTTVFSGLTALSSFVGNLMQVVPQIQKTASQVIPFFYSVAFVLLVFGTMRGFLQNDTQRLFGNVLRVVILVALMGSFPVIAGAVSSAVNSFCSAENSSNSLLQANDSGSGQLNISALQSMIMQKGLANLPGASLQQFFSPVTHYLCMILYGIYILALLFCELIAGGMDLLQQCVLIFFNLYVPIGFAEFSIPNLRGQAETFFKAYVGVQCWPIGWILANIVTISLFKCLAAPAPENAISILIAIVVCIPIALWMVIGYVLAPFYIQKVVMRGGGEVQAFVGAMISAVGGTTGSVFGGAFGLGRSATAGLNHGFGAIRSSVGKGSFSSNGSYRSQSTNNSATQGDGSNGQQDIGADDMLDYVLPGYRNIENSGGSDGGAVDRARNLGVWSLSKVVDAGEFAARTAGNMANTLGTLVADASGNRIGPERYFSFPQVKRNPPNRSSRRAASYLTQSAP